MAEPAFFFDEKATDSPLAERTADFWHLRCSAVARSWLAKRAADHRGAVRNPAVQVAVREGGRVRATRSFSTTGVKSHYFGKPPIAKRLRALKRGLALAQSTAHDLEGRPQNGEDAPWLWIRRSRARPRRRWPWARGASGTWRGGGVACEIAPERRALMSVYQPDIARPPAPAQWRTCRPRQNRRAYGQGCGSLRPAPCCAR